MFLKKYLMPAKAWIILRVAIVDAGVDVDCRPIVDWLQVALTRKGGD